MRRHLQLMVVSVAFGGGLVALVFVLPRLLEMK